MALADQNNGSQAVAIPSLTPLQIFTRFLKFGALAWGGPVAQLAMIKAELVDDERWMSNSRFNRLLAVYQVLPGPEAHEMCVHIGMLAGKRLGGVLAGLGFMLPGLVLMLIASWAYTAIDLSQPQVIAAFLGVQIGVIALITRAVHRIGQHILTEPWLWTIAVCSALASALGVSFWIVLPAAGVISVYRWSPVSLAAGVGAAVLAFVTHAADVGTISTWLHAGRDTDPLPLIASTEPTLLALFLSGLKAGLLTFGGAYTAIPFIRDDAVGNGWMTDSQFLDGLALSGIIPAPLIIFSTFVGYVAAGPFGALAMTAGIFLPAFGFTLLFFEQLERVVHHRGLQDFLEGVAAAVVGLIVLTTIELATGVAARVEVPLTALVILTVSLAVLYRWRSKLSVPTIVLGSGALAWLLGV